MRVGGCFLFPVSEAYVRLDVPYRIRMGPRRVLVPPVVPRNKTHTPPPTPIFNSFEINGGRLNEQNT